MNNDYVEVKPLKLTTTTLDNVEPTGNGVLIAVKSWPTQTAAGIIVPDGNVVIRGEKYVTEVIDVGENVSIVEKGDVVVMSMYSGHHIATDSGHAKIIRDTDILTFKKETTMLLHPETFTPGINYMLVKITKEKEIITDAGLVIPTSSFSNKSKQDVATTTGEVVSIGDSNEYGKKFDNVKVGSTVIFDSYVGLDVPMADASGNTRFLVMYVESAIGVIGK